MAQSIEHTVPSEKNSELCDLRASVVKTIFSPLLAVLPRRVLCGIASNSCLTELTGESHSPNSRFLLCAFASWREILRFG